MMDKVICDICGTQYDESEGQCPLCGCAKITSAFEAQDGETVDSHVKGGRFSKSNVRRRTRSDGSEAKVATPVPEIYDDDDDEEKPQSNRGLLIIVVLLLLAIIAVSAYIAVVFMDNAPKETNSTSSTTSPIPLNVPCTGISVTERSVTLNSANGTYQIVYSLMPAETTDKVVFTSANPQIAKVSESGLIQAVSSGSVVISIACGDQQTQIFVACDFEGGPTNSTTKPTTKPTTAPTTKPTTPVEDVLKLNRTEFMLTGAGDSWNVYSGNLDRTLITWSSSDENVATVVDGRVVAVSNGNIVITATYKDQKATCKVYVRGITNTQPTEPVSESDLLKLNRTDFTLYSVGESHNLYSGDLDKTQITWTSKNTEVATVVDGVVTAVGDGDTQIVATYKDQTVVCDVRVRIA